MTQRNTLIVISIATLALVPAAAADEGRLYIGASVGSASLNEAFDGFDVDSDSTALRVVAGWQFSETFSLEGGYHNFGTFEQRFVVGGEPVDVSLKADGFTLGATGTVPLGHKFALHGRAGWFFWDGDGDINGVSQARPEDTNLYLGVGIKYAFNPRLSLLGDWSRYELQDTRSDVVSLGAMFRF